jgi:tRNA(Arg) A34 adenosine deaminase TadA
VSGGRDRREAAALVSGAALMALFAPARASAEDARVFMAEAFRMRDEAVAAGDQPYGAVIVMDGRIIGRGRSRVIADRNNDHHAERLALSAAQSALGRDDLAGAVIYSTSIPCGACQPALARARLARMVYGTSAKDGGAPRAGG